MAECSLRRLQPLRHRSEHRLGIDDAGRIVRRVEDQRLRPRIQLSSEILRVREERHRIRSGFDQYAVIIGDITAVLAEVRGHGDDLIARIEDRLQNHVQSSGRTHRHHEMLRPVVGSVPAVQLTGQPLTDILVSGVVHIAVDQHRVLLRHDPDDRLTHRVRRRHVGIAQTEIIHLVGAVDRRHPAAFLEHRPDRRAARHIGLHFSRNHADPPPLPAVIPQRSSCAISSPCSGCAPPSPARPL